MRLKDLLKEQKVALVPGVAFGKDWNDNVRISYASSFDDLKEVFKRLMVKLQE